VHSRVNRFRSRIMSSRDVLAIVLSRTSNRQRLKIRERSLTVKGLRFLYDLIFFAMFSREVQPEFMRGNVQFHIQHVFS